MLIFVAFSYKKVHRWCFFFFSKVNVWLISLLYEMSRILFSLHPSEFHLAFERCLTYKKKLLKCNKNCSQESGKRTCFGHNLRSPLRQVPAALSRHTPSWLCWVCLLAVASWIQWTPHFYVISFLQMHADASTHTDTIIHTHTYETGHLKWWDCIAISSLSSAMVTAVRPSVSLFAIRPSVVHLLWCYFSLLRPGLA